MKVGIYFGSSTGTTQDVAERIASAMGVDAADVHDISSADAASAANYDLLILGSSTWGSGELQDDWYDFKDALKPYLAGKKVALFGTGDAGSYDDTFCDAVGDLYDEFQDAACTFIGDTATDGYDYSDSRAERNGRFVGLVLDEVNESDKSDDRINAWVATLK